MSPAPGSPASAPPAAAPVRVLLCECAGTMASNIDFDRLERRLTAPAVAVERRRAWCGRDGGARLMELLEMGEGAGRLLLAGCAADFAARRFRGLAARGLRLEVCDIRESCSWVHGGDRDPVTDKALRIVQAATRCPGPREKPLPARPRIDRVVVVGGGLAGTRAATELARMGHPVELLERRPFLGGRAARIGPVFPTGDCGPCLPAPGARPGVRSCLHRNEDLEHPNLRIRRRTEVVSVTGGAGDLSVQVRSLPAMIGSECVDCGLCERVCPVRDPAGGCAAILADPYDGRVLRAIDLDRCTRCGACAEACPVGAIDLTPAAEVDVVEAGAVLIATGCEPAPGNLVRHLGHGEAGVVTQVELAGRLDVWEERAGSAGAPARHLLMVQCAGSRDRRGLPYCSRLCCMIALKHAIRLRRLFPAMRVTICFQELRTPGARDEEWYSTARREGVEFIRGSPAAVERDAAGGLVVELEDVATTRLRRLRPDLVVLSTGLVPAADGMSLARILGAPVDGAGFVLPLDAKNRPVETRAEGVFACGSATGPKTISESITEAAAAAARIHGFLTSDARRGDRSPAVDPVRCTGCGACVPACPFAAVSLAERPGRLPRPVSVRGGTRLALIDAAACRGCGICASRCPELAIAHPLEDATLLARLETLIGGVEQPVVGLVCAECAAAALSLGGRRRDPYPERVRLIELPCLGRVSALHLVEAARLGAAAVFLAGCVEGQCQYRSGDRSAIEQVALAQDLLRRGGREVPIEMWRLCAVAHGSVGRRIRDLCSRLGPVTPAAAGRGG